MSRLAGASPPPASLRGLDADKWQRGHVGPPVAALGGNPTSPLYFVRCSVASVSGHDGVPPCPSTTRLSRGMHGSRGARPLRQNYITPHCPQCQPVSRKLLLCLAPLRALRVKATGVMQNCLRWSRSHSRRRFPVAFAPNAPPTGSLAAVVAPWHWSGASRSVLVSGLRPFMLYVPRPPVGLATLRGHWPCAGLPVRPQGAPSAQRKILLARSKNNAAGASRLRCLSTTPPTSRKCVIGNDKWEFRETATERQPETQSEPEIRKDLEHFYSKSLIHMVGVKGFEPSTPCTPCKCATRLRHTPTSLRL